MQAEVFRPLGMVNSTFLQPLPEALRRASHGGQRGQRLWLRLLEVVRLPSLARVQGIQAHEHVLGHVDEIGAGLVGRAGDIEQTVLLVRGVHGAFSGQAQTQRPPPYSHRAQ